MFYSETQSLKTIYRFCVTFISCRYLQCEWNAKKSEERQIAKIVRGSTPKVPQQSNFSDCGVFLLQYVQSFFEVSMREE